MSQRFGNFVRVSITPEILLAANILYHIIPLFQAGDMPTIGAEALNSVSNCIPRIYLLHSRIPVVKVAIDGHTVGFAVRWVTIRHIRANTKIIEVKQGTVRIVCGAKVLLHPALPSYLHSVIDVAVIVHHRRHTRAGLVREHNRLTTCVLNHAVEAVNLFKQCIHSCQQIGNVSFSQIGHVVVKCAHVRRNRGLVEDFRRTGGGVPVGVDLRGNLRCIDITRIVVKRADILWCVRQIVVIPAEPVLGRFRIQRIRHAQQLLGGGDRIVAAAVRVGFGLQVEGTVPPVDVGEGALLHAPATDAEGHQSVGVCGARLGLHIHRTAAGTSLQDAHAHTHLRVGH